MRAWFSDHPDAADALLAVSLLAVALFEFNLAPHALRSTGVELLLVAGLFLPLARRRREPRLVLFVVSAAAAGVWIGRYQDGLTAAAGALAFYGVGRYVERPASLHAFSLATAGLVAVSAVLSATSEEPSPWFPLVARCGVIFGAFWFGESQRMRTALLESLHAQAARAESERTAQAQRAVLEERSRIARELHDVVAHSVSVMVIQAAAAERLASKDANAAAASIAHVATVGRSALAEMRRIFGILDVSSSPADFAPQPRLSDLAALIERCRAAGLDVTLEQHGAQPPLSAGLELSIVRVVQESLTNVMKHAGAAHARVRLAFAEELSIEVTDDGSGARSEAPSDGRGRGLIGMRERVEALAGTFHAGPRAEGGFVVRAVVPLEPSAEVPP